MIRKRNGGFTLIELLVVIAIIAILAAILFPVFARARESARQSNCQSNLKQMAQALLMYVDDYDGKFPPSKICWGSDSYAVSQGWGHTIQWYIKPYIKSEEVLRCKSDKGIPGWVAKSVFYYACDPGYRCSYSWVGELGYCKSLAKLKKPAETPMVFEPYWWHRQITTQAHMEHRMVAYVDSHVEFVTEQKFAYDNPSQLSNWNY